MTQEEIIDLAQRYIDSLRDCCGCSGDHDLWVEWHNLVTETKWSQRETPQSED